MLPVTDACGQADAALKTIDAAKIIARRTLVTIRSPPGGERTPEIHSNRGGRPQRSWRRRPAWGYIGASRQEGGSMRSRSVVAVGALCAFMFVSSFVGPSSLAGQGKPTTSTWKVPRTSWGDPDVQGIWTTNEMHAVPLERPKQFADRDTLTREEASARREQTTQGTVNAEGIGNYDRAFRDTAIGFTKQRISTQASLIVDPKDGMLPPLTPEAQKRRGAQPQRSKWPGDWTDLSPWNRCITRGTLTIVEPSGYNNGVQIVQGRGYVAIQKEMIHETRVVPIDAGPHLGSKLKLWAGDPRGRWEGDTLVIEVTNLDGRGPLFGASANARVTERFRRLGPDELEYLFTVDDPGTWTRPWTGRMTMSLEPEQYELVEYACHEANYSMANSLSAARAQEKVEAAKKK